MSIFIAEIKTASMFGYKSIYSRYYLTQLAITCGDWISVHTDPRFGGSFDDIYQIRKMTKKPILAKGFHTHNDDIKKAFDLGADYVLTVRPPTLSLCDKFNVDKLLFEVDKVGDIRLDYQYKYVYNSRDLNTGWKKYSLNEYLEFREKCAWLCGASMVSDSKMAEKLYPKHDAVLVGTELVNYCNTLI